MNAIADALRALVNVTRPIKTPDGDLFPQAWHDARAALAAHGPECDAIAAAAEEAASLADTAPAHAREFWRRLAGSLRKAATVPR